MSIRKKGRNRFDFHGRSFTWWIDNDEFLRISCDDKKFIVAVPLGHAINQSPLIHVIGKEFPGVEVTQRPLQFEIPEFEHGSLGRWVQLILEWSFSSSKILTPIESSAPR